MTQNPTSGTGEPRPGPWLAPAQPASFRSTNRLRATDAHLLSLVSEHEVLTSSQLVRLTGLPERTVQHRLGRLHRAGLINRARPSAAVGTSPYHCWLTPFGATATGVSDPETWGDDPAGMRATAVLSELWLALLDQGEEASLHLENWQRLRSGLLYRDRRDSAERKLPVQAQRTVSLAHRTSVEVLVTSRLEQVAAARLTVAPRRRRSSWSSGTRQSL